MELKDYREQPDSGLYEKIERRLRLRRLVRVGSGVAVACVAVAAVVWVAWPGKSGAGEPGPMVAAMQPSQVQAMSSSAQTDVEDRQSVGFEAMAVSSTSPKQGEVDARSADAGVSVAEQAVSPTHSSVSLNQAASSPNLGEQQDGAVVTSETFTQVGVSVNDQSETMYREINVGSVDGGTPSAQQAEVMPAAKGKDPSSTIVHEDNLMWAPNVIAPGGDVDENRTFKLKFTSAVTEFRIVIFNRGGRQLYQSEDPNFSWDGTHNGTAMPQGAYVWVAKFRDSDGRVHQEKGTVTIIR